MNKTAITNQELIGSIIYHISIGDIKALHGFMVRSQKFSILKHYFMYYGEVEGEHMFLITMKDLEVVSLINDQQLLAIANKYDFTLEEMIPFEGSSYEQEQAIQRANSTLGKPYSWVGRNCENLINYVHTGKSKSDQTRTASSLVALTGGVMMSSKNKGAQKLGLAVGILGLVVLLMEVLGEDKF